MMQMILWIALLLNVYSSELFGGKLDDSISKLSHEEIEKKLGVTYQRHNEKEELLFKFLRNEKKDACFKRGDLPSFFRFVPGLKGKLYNVGDKITFSSLCYQKNTIEWVKTEGETKFHFTITPEEQIEDFCTDYYIYYLSSNLHVDYVISKEPHEIIMEIPKEHLIEIEAHGIRVFGLCQGIVETAISLYDTVRLILSDYKKNDYIPLGKARIPEEQEQEHIDFLRDYSNSIIERRNGYEDIVLPIEDQIQSGDFLGLSQVINGESCIIQYFTGGRISHSCIALRDENNKLFVYESNTPTVIFRPYDEFIKEQIETNHSVAWFPLSQEYRKKWNNTAALKFAREKIGMPYGWRTFAAGDIDIEGGFVADYMDDEMILLCVDIVEKFEPKWADVFITASVNKRLGTENLKVKDLVLEIAKRKTTWEKVMTIPEKDEWTYNGVEQWVCSGLVVGVYKAAGIFDGMDINAHEFVPKDIYQLKIYDPNSKETRPDVCKKADPDIPYCMIMGKFRILAKGYNTVEPYSHMNEKCTNIPPFYERTPGC